jgi:hypothetical protein
MARSFDFVNWTLTTEGCKILASSLLQILAEIVLELALIAKPALLGRELVEQSAAAAQW